MKRKSFGAKASLSRYETPDWLPVERWLVPSLHFSHVHGIARVFLIVEMALSAAVVFGSLLLIAFRYL